jgi:hypothetical protein
MTRPTKERLDYIRNHLTDPSEDDLLAEIDALTVERNEARKLALAAMSYPDALRYAEAWDMELAET